MFLSLPLSHTLSLFHSISLFSVSPSPSLSLAAPTRPTTGCRPAVSPPPQRPARALRHYLPLICANDCVVEPAKRSAAAEKMGQGQDTKKDQTVPAMSREATWGHRARAGGREAAACVSLSLPPSVSGNRRSTTTAQLAGMEAADLEEADPPVDEAMAPGRAEVSPAASPSLVVPSLLPSHLLSLPISTCHVCLFSVPAA
eukprot:COSAG03_NODE_1281_length_4409_cov_506.251044_3_plen_200_part_00